VAALQPLEAGVLAASQDPVVVQAAVAQVNPDEVKDLPSPQSHLLPVRARVQLLAYLNWSGLRRSGVERNTLCLAFSSSV
jgi:hypothetical protein